MTFGEHLHELRKCLIRALLGLAVGMLIGFFLGKHVVDFIQRPLRIALKDYVANRELEKFDQEVASLKNSGLALPWTKAQAESEIHDRELLPEVVYVRPSDLAALLPGAAKTVQPGPRKPDPANSANGKSAAPTTAAESPAAEDAPESAAEAAEQPLPLILLHDIETDDRTRPTALVAHEVFMIWLKASLLVGAVLSSPWLFYQLWTFVAAGLYPHEKRYVNIYLPFSIVLFLTGVLVAFFAVFPLVLKFLFSFNYSMGIDIDPRISEWLSFVLFLPVGFGIAFQLPLAMLFLQRIGVFTVRAYLSYWRVAVLVIFVIAAILTPPDPYSMTLLAAPLTLLYFAGILLCMWMPKGQSLLDPIEDS